MQRISEMLERALAEDLADCGDITTNSTIAADARAKAVVKAKEDGIFAGAEIVPMLFALFPEPPSYTISISDGSFFKSGDTLIVLEGKTRTLLTLERTLLNVLSMICGIATKVRTYVDLAAPFGTTILDTRKTLPGLRDISKYAVRVGGATNHRIGLYDQVMIKDNHVAACGSITQAVERVRRSLGPEIFIVVETRNIAEVNEAVLLPVDRIMLDNMNEYEISAAVSSIAGRKPTEVSGNLGLNTVATYAKLGVTCLSIGDLTKNIHSIDISMKIS